MRPGSSLNPLSKTNMRAVWIALACSAPLLAQDEAARPPREFVRILEEGTIEERLHLSVWLMRENGRRMLAPTEAQRDGVADLLRLDDTGITCLDKGGALQYLVAEHEGGRYFSFEEENHADNYFEIDLRLERGFDANVYGDRVGLIVPLGNVSLADLPTQRDPVPDWGPDLVEAWHACWENLSPEDAEYGSDFRKRWEAYFRPQTPKEGRTYLLRLCQFGGPNRLTAFRVLGENDHGAVTIAWRVLKRWPGALAGNRGRSRHAHISDAPNWLWEAYEGVETPTLVSWLEELRARSRPLLLDIDEDLQERYRKVITAPGDSFADRGGFARIVQRHEYVPLVGEGGGGACFSFREGRHTWNGGQLGVEGKQFRGPFAGNRMVDLGDLDFADVSRAVAGERPRAVAADPDLDAAWELLHSFRRSAPRKVDEATTARLEELGIGRGCQAVLGHSFLYRNTQAAEGDELVFLTVLEIDDVGVSVAWRILESFPLKSR